MGADLLPTIMGFGGMVTVLVGVILVWQFFKRRQQTGHQDIGWIQNKAVEKSGSNLSQHGHSKHGYL